MNLQQLLIGTFVPPPVVSSRIHRCGFSDLPRYSQPKPHIVKERDLLNRTEKRVLAVISKFKQPASALEAGKLLDMTRNNCSIILSSLFKKGMVTRSKVTKKSTRFYLYSAKDTD